MSASTNARYAIVSLDCSSASIIAVTVANWFVVLVLLTSNMWQGIRTKE